MKTRLPRFAARHVAAAAVVVLLLLAAGFAAADSDYFFKINKSIDVFGRVYKEVTLNYVDDIDPEKFMESGIDGLLGTLDPYTNFINESEGDEVELITSGKYGGIGITITVRDGYITVSSVMEGYAAQRQGMLPGDRLLEIEGKSVVGVRPESVRSLTRGEPGTEVHVKVERDGEPGPIMFVLVREEIQLKNISYADTIGRGIGYIHLDRFTRTAGDELRLAIKDLRLKANLKGIILDVRDNPGGLLDAATSVVQKFLPKGSLIVSTRGRRSETERKYYATEEPMVPDVPMVVLTNRSSASASEIVAGAIQDLDRGVILGTRSFGKGLVQNVLPLPYNTQLKMTTAKYYTPSGRCIQEIDYLHKNKDGVFAITPDSLRRGFKTARGRTVLEAGGIQPDTVVNDPEPSTFHKELLRKSMYVKFAMQFLTGRKDSTLGGVADAALLDGFQSFLTEQKFSYQDDAEQKLSELKAVFGTSGYGEAAENELAALAARIARRKQDDVKRNAAEVLRMLKAEIMGRVRGEHGRIGATISADAQVQAAAALLARPAEYSRLLNPR